MYFFRWKRSESKYSKFLNTLENILASFDSVAVKMVSTLLIPPVSFPGFWFGLIWFDSNDISTIVG